MLVMIFELRIQSAATAHCIHHPSPVPRHVHAGRVPPQPSPAARAPVLYQNPLTPATLRCSSSRP
jgi:hypothetical protein